MPAPPPLLTELAQAVADGHEPDWAALASASLSESQREVYQQLQAISEIGRCLASASAHLSLQPAFFDPAAEGNGDPAVGGIPARWGTLVIRERVGRGRFGDVYRAWDPAIDRDVALKLLRRRPPHLEASDAVVVQEGRLMARVRHPNVITIHGAAHIDGRTGLWMEFVEGRTLDAELQLGGRYRPDEAVRVGIELCRALAAVHDAGLVHRDVKAQNVMREASGRIVLGDFGTGLDVEDGADGRSTIAGTPVYLAPEIFARAPATPQSDIYSLGVLLFHVMTGSYPVTGRTIDEIRRAHAASGRRALRDVSPEIDERLAAAIDRALDPDRSRRFARAVDMERALTAAIAADAAPPTPSASEPQSAVLPAAALGRGRRLATSVGLIVAAAMLVWSPVRGRLSVGSSPPARPGQALAGALVPTQELSRVPAPTEYQFLGRPSPDGRAYTYTDMEGNLALFDPLTGERRQLTDRKAAGGTTYMSAPFSSDGTHIAYSWQADPDQWELRIMSAAGGDSRVVVRSGAVITHPLQWSTDGTKVLVLLERRDGTRHLAMTSIADGSTAPIVRVDSGHTGASLSPDGRYVVFDHAQRPDSFDRDVSIIALDAPGEPRPLAAGARDDFGPLWTPGGDRVIFVSDRTGEPSVWMVRVERGMPEGVPAILQRNIGRSTPIALTADGTLFYDQAVGLVDVFAATLDMRTGTVIAEPRPVTPSQVGSNITSSWSPDGRYLACVTLPHAGSSEARRISIVNAETGATRVLSPLLRFYQFPRWSRDGRMLAVRGYDFQLRDGVYLVDPETGATRPAALATENTPTIGAFAWAADPHTLLLVRRDVGLMSVDLGTGIEQPVFTYASEGILSFQANPGFRLSRDGRSIVYAGFRKTAHGQEEGVLRIKEFGHPARDLVVGALGIGDWTADETEVLLTRPVRNSRNQSLWIVPVAGGEPRPAGLELPGLRDVSVHPDGQRITFTSGFPGAELWRLDKFLPNR